VPFFGLLIVTATRLSAIQQESADQYLSSNLRTVSATVDQALRNVEFSHTMIFQDANFLNAMRRLAPYDTREEYSDFLNTNAIKGRIGEVAATNDYIDSIYAYSFLARRVFCSNVNWNPAFNHFPESSSDWLETHLANGRRQPWSITRDITSDNVIISSFREIWVFGSETPVGLLSINVDAGDITHMLDEITPQPAGYTFILDGEGNTISNQSGGSAFDEIKSHIPVSTANGYFTLKLMGEETLVSFYTSGYSGFTYVISTPLNQVRTSVPLMITLIFLFLLLVVLAAALALFLVHRLFFKPVTALFAGMEAVEKGDFAVRLPQNNTYEFGYIYNNFNRMAENIQKLVLENYTSALINKEVELRNMQNQLNEHFLYNTLDSIHWLARSENSPQVCDMVFALANFYRQSLSSGKEVIPVRDIIEMCKNYLFLQQYRMKDMFEYNIACEERFRDEPILKTLLQPIIENAIVHGLKKSPRAGRIDVTFTGENGFMRVSVRDNGVGFEAERLRMVKEQLDSGDPYCVQSFALKSVQSQMQIFYGMDINLNIETTQGEGATVWFDLPSKHVL
jgi:two-component system sensor histidine kinase YesM